MWSSLRKRLSSLAANPDFRNSLLLVFTLWLARYWYTLRFGLYEDDLTIIPRAMQMDLGELFTFVGSYISHLYGHARPLSDSFIYIFSNFGFKLFGFHGPYVFGFFFVALNGMLFYGLMRRAAGQTAALFCGLAYVLFSADTTQSFLTHSLGLHPSLTLLLLAAHAYLARRAWLAYLLAFIILFSYESPFLVFVGIPLLQKEWDRRLFKEMLRHVIILAVMLAAVYLLRMAIGEGRVSELSLPEMIWVSIWHSAVGPAVSLATYFYRPVQALRGFNLEVGLAILAAWAAFGFFLQNQPALAPLSISLLKPRARFWAAWPEELKSRLRLLAAGLVMLAGAYPLTFTVRPYAITGRDTRVHAAGVVGAAIVVGILAVLLLHFLKKAPRQRIAAWAAAGLFALLMGYGFVLQQDYAQGWRAQQRFWRELLPLVSDATENTIILVEPGVFSYESKQMGANTWNLPRTLDQIFTFPAAWENAPRVYRLEPGWDSRIGLPDGRLRLDASTTIAPPSLYADVDAKNVILIQAGDQPYRRTASLTLGDLTFGLKQWTLPFLPSLPHGFLYPYLIGE